jgi:HPt (histidine-containing phosphotransfer) domain-containing protein
VRNAESEEVDRAGLLEQVAGGDLGLLKEVVGVFLDDSPAMLADVKQAVDRGDAAALRRAAHKLKGVVANFGAPAAVAAALRLEEMGLGQDLSGAAAAYDELAAALGRLRPELERILGTED